MSLKRLLALLVFAFAASVLFVPGAGAGNFDEQKMGCGGEAPATCPTGTVGQPYSMTIYLSPPDGGRGEDFGCATFHVTSGSFPPGLSISGDGIIKGTPTQAGTFRFYLTVKYDEHPGCAKTPSDDEFIIQINAPVPKLVIGPEQSGVPPATVGEPFSLPMTANLSDPKTWSISEGALPAGLTLGASDGLISGTPTAAGTFSFTVKSVIDAQRTDTKALAITVREPLVLEAPQTNGTAANGLPPSEVGVRFVAPFTASGGLAPYTWAVSAGALPPGLVLGSKGILAGVPTTAGRYGFTVSVADAEGRTETYNALVRVTERLAISTSLVRRAKVGRLYKQNLKTTGGVNPKSWRVKKGLLPRGIRLKAKLGVLTGRPRQAGTYRVTVEVTDALGVKSTQTYTLVVLP